MKINGTKSKYKKYSVGDLLQIIRIRSELSKTYKDSIHRGLEILSHLDVSDVVYLDDSDPDDKCFSLFLDEFLEQKNDFMVSVTKNSNLAYPLTYLKRDSRVISLPVESVEVTEGLEFFETIQKLLENEHYDAVRGILNAGSIGFIYNNYVYNYGIDNNRIMLMSYNTNVTSSLTKEESTLLSSIGLTQPKKKHLQFRLPKIDGTWLIDYNSVDKKLSDALVEIFYEQTASCEILSPSITNSDIKGAIMELSTQPYIKYWD